MRRPCAFTTLITLATAAAFLPPATAFADHGGSPGAVTDQSCSQVTPDVRRCDQTVESFDGTAINTHLFIPDGTDATSPAPLILRGHGYGGSGEEDVGDGTLRALTDEGWLVLTWDARGHNESEGFIQVDSPAYERRDTEILIDVFGARDEVIQQAPGDPLVGFTGISYAGGIQLVTAAFDPRVDAIAPEITWNDLRYSLASIQQAAAPLPVVKDSWIAALIEFGSQPPDRQAPWIDTAAAQGLATNEIDAETIDRFGFRSYATVYDRALAADLGPAGHAMADAASPIDVPTLFLQGNVDTLFNVTEAQHSFRELRARGVPTKLFVFCGGVDGGGRTTHGFCPTDYTDADDQAKGDELIVDWFRRHLLGDTTVDTGPPVEWESNTGVFRRRGDFPDAGSGARTLTATGTVVHDGLQVSPPPPSGDFDQSGEFPPDLERGSVAPFASQPGDPTEPGVLESGGIAAAQRAIDLVGVPTLDVTVAAPSAPAAAPQGLPPPGDVIHLFFKLVDYDPADGSREVVNVQEAALRVEGTDGAPQSFTIDLPGVAYTLPQGHEVRLQVDTGSFISAESRNVNSVDVEATVRLPLRAAGTERFGGSTRVGTGVALSDAVRQAATTVVIARSDDYADALAGVPLAADLDAPMLLTPPSRLAPEVAREIRRLGATDAVVLGGGAAVSPAVVTALTDDLGLRVRRHAGSTRFGTAVDIADELPGSKAILVEGADPDPSRGWPDAVAAGPLGHATDAAVLLTTTDALPDQTRDKLRDYDELQIIGGEAAVSSAVEQAAEAAVGAAADRIEGADRQATSRLVAEAAVAAGADPATTVLATGRAYPDALTAGAAAVAFDAPLLLIGDEFTSTTPARVFLGSRAAQVERVLLAGGPAAIPPDVASAIDTFLAD